MKLEASIFGVLVFLIGCSLLFINFWDVDTPIKSLSFDMLSENEAEVGVVWAELYSAAIDSKDTLILTFVLQSDKKSLNGTFFDLTKAVIQLNEKENFYGPDFNIEYVWGKPSVSFGLIAEGDVVRIVLPLSDELKNLDSVKLKFKPVDGVNTNAKIFLNGKDGKYVNVWP